MKLFLIYFSKDGEALAKSIKSGLAPNHEIHLFCGYGEDKMKLSTFCEKSFQEAQGILFLSATGIAVRGIAPFVKNKVNDPAVLVIDDTGKFVISLLSGHLGKANHLTHEVAAYLHAIPVITTATDNRNLFAVDSFATKQGFALIHPQQIKVVSSALLRGETIGIFAPEYELILGEQMLQTTEQTKAHVVIHRKETDILTLIPRNYYLGMGCRKDSDPEMLIHFVQTQLEKLGISPLALCGLFSVTLKAEENALLQLSKLWNLPFQVFSPEILQEQEGDFSASDFVLSQIGTDNVCERSVMVAGADEIILKKVSQEGMTLAVGRKNMCIDMRTSSSSI